MLWGVKVVFSPWHSDAASPSSHWPICHIPLSNWERLFYIVFHFNNYTLSKHAKMLLIGYQNVCVNGTCIQQVLWTKQTSICITTHIHTVWTNCLPWKKTSARVVHLSLPVVLSLKELKLVFDPVAWLCHGKLESRLPRLMRCLGTKIQIRLWQNGTTTTPITKSVAYLE